MNRINAKHIIIIFFCICFMYSCRENTENFQWQTKWTRIDHEQFSKLGLFDNHNIKWILESTSYMMVEIEDLNNLKITGNVVGFYSNGNLFFFGKLVDNKCSGTWKKYYPSGKLFSITEYCNNQYHGLSQVWYENGIPCSICWRHDGFALINSTRYEWYENGVLRERTEYTRGIGKGDDDFDCRGNIFDSNGNVIAKVESNAIVPLSKEGKILWSDDEKSKWFNNDREIWGNPWQENLNKIRNLKVVDKDSIDIQTPKSATKPVLP